MCEFRLEFLSLKKIKIKIKEEEEVIGEDKKLTGREKLQLI